MNTTERKHWQNGHQLRGYWFHTFNVSFYFFGVMFSWGKHPNRFKKDNLKIEIFRFV